MFRKLFATLAVAAALAASLAAQDKPNFSGAWKLNLSKSDFGVLPAPDSRTDAITQTAASLKDDISEDSAQGKRNYTMSYTLDGKEVVNTPGGTEIKSVAAWDGPALVVNSKLKYQDSDVEIKTSWTLSADGATLTANSHLASAMGETDQKLVFDKQGAAPAAPSGSAASPAPPAAPSVTPSVAPSAKPGAQPNFSGNWKLDVSKSDFGVLPGPDSRSDKIEQTAGSVKDSIDADTAQGKQAYTLLYTTDGKEAVNTPGGLEVKSTARWEGPTLVINSKLKYQDSDVEIKSVWTLSADGKTLTMDSHLSSAMGETDQKFVFARQEGGAGPSAAPAPAGAHPNPS